MAALARQGHWFNSRMNITKVITFLLDLILTPQDETHTLYHFQMLWLYRS